MVVVVVVEVVVLGGVAFVVDVVELAVVDAFVTSSLVVAFELVVDILFFFQ